MRHAWILDVLADLRSYAENNDLHAIAAAAAQTHAIAVAEISEQGCDDASANQSGTAAD